MSKPPTPIAYCPHCRTDRPVLIAAGSVSDNLFPGPVESWCYYHCSVCRHPVQPPTTPQYHAGTEGDEQS